MHSVVTSILLLIGDIFTRNYGRIVRLYRHIDENMGELTWMIWIKP